jgi:spermidine synthase
MNRQRKAVIAALVVIFFISGFNALLYQVVWQRLLGLFSGSDVRSVTIVVSAFLAGLGVGSLIGAMIADGMSSGRAVRLFGWCNVGIALFALLSRFLYYDLLFLRLNTLSQSPVTLLAVAFVSLLWPTILMGLSLPLLSRAVVNQTAAKANRVSSAAGRISLLYGGNTVGAGAGALVAGWYLVGAYGYDQTLRIGAVLSLIVGFAALLIARQFNQADEGEKKPAAVAGGRPRWPNIPRDVAIWMFLLFTSGFMAISLELIWFRILDVSLKSNAYTFAYLLAFYLVGDGLGSLIGIRFLPRIHQPRRAFFIILAAVALYSILAVWGATELVTRYEPLAHYVAQTEGVTALGADMSWRSWIIYLILPLVIMLPPAILLGFYFPVAQKAIQTDYQTVGQRVGLVKVANILGNATGGIVTGALLLHLWGTTGSLRVIGLLGLLFVLFWLVESWRERLPAASGKRSWPAAPSALLLGGALLLVVLVFPGADTIWGRLHGATAADLFLVAEDSTGVTALRRPLDNSAAAILFANGQSQATIPFLSLHGLLGALPALVHPQPERILIIGIGSAGTPYAAGVNPLTREITAVEIIGSELDVLRAYAGYEGGQVLGHFFADPRYRIIIGDGRRELALAGQTYDIIQADAIRPTSSHSGLLYSREFFEAVRDKLAPGGIMTQWRATDRVEATFVAVFPYVINIGNFILLGSSQPIEYDPQQVLDRFYQPQMQQYLAAGGYHVDHMRPWIDSQPVFWLPETPRPDQDTNSDLHPKDEYYMNK